MTYTVNELAPFGVLITANEDSYSVAEMDIALLKGYFEEYKLVVLRGFKAFDSAHAFADYCAGWGEVSMWPFGRVLELKKQSNPEDHIFDNNYVPLHWDGMYRPEVPQYQLFHCVDSPDTDQGGETTFSNTAIVIENAAPASIERWKNTKVRYTRKMEFYESVTVSPIVTKHPFSEQFVMRYNEPPAKDVANFINPPIIEFLDVADDELEDLQRELKESLYSPDVYYAHVWEQGDVVISDNFTLLHGREPYTNDAPRHLQRVHVNSSPAFKNPGLENYK